MGDKKTTSEVNKASDVKQTLEELATQKATLDQKEQELKGFKQSLVEKEQRLNEREQYLSKKEQELNDRMADLPVVDAQEVKVNQVVEFKFRGDNYKFTDDAPKKIRFGGVAYSQKEVVKDEDILTQLVGGNSSLIQKL
ncbi:hypothetical protein R8G61_05125 [Tenacibaculum maritimum]